MTRSEPDLTAVRDAAVDIAGPGARPDADAVARTWARVSASSGPRRSWRRLLVPGGAAAAVLVVTAAALILRPGPAQEPVDIGAQPQAPVTPVPADTVPPKDGTPVDPSVVVPTVTVFGAGTTVRTVTVSSVVDEMVARAASVAPVTMSAGQLIYGVYLEGGRTATGQATQPMAREWWINPDTGTVDLIRMAGREFGAGSMPSGTPGFGEPTRQWLANLSTDPATLYNELAAINAGTKNGGAAYVLKELSGLLRTTDPVLSPALRAGLYRALTRINGLTAKEINVAGHTLYRLTQSGPIAPNDLLLDPATGRVAGTARVDGVQDGNPVDTIELWSFAVVDKVRDQS